MTTRQFDGPTLEAALAKVRKELGADARITGAEKVRQGGIGGFFSRERVEVSVEIDDPTVPLTMPAAASTGTPTMATAAPAPTAAEPRTPASILDLADSVSDDETMAVSTESASFAAVLERIASEADVAVAAQTALDPNPEFEPMPAPAPVSAPKPAPAAKPAPAPAPMATIPSSPAAAAPARAPRPLVVPRPAALSPVPAHAPQLEKLGLPGQLMPMDASHGLHCALIDALADLPMAPALPAGRGTVLAVVGERSAALEIARELAVDLRVHPDEVVMCTPTRRGRSTNDAETFELNTPEDADEHRRSWRRRFEPTIVVIDAAPVARNRGWARDMLAVLEPTSAWGVADATRKLEDIEAWTEDLGGLDAMAITNLADTVSPASILQLGVPVAVLDGEPASPELWADILMERLAA